MNRKDMAVVAVLVTILILWPHMDRWIVRKFFPERWAPPAVVRTSEAISSSDEEAVLRPGVEPSETPILHPAPEDGTEPVQKTTPQGSSPPVENEEPADPARLYVLRNAHAEYTFSSHGAALISARLLDYRATFDRDSEPVSLHFSETPALVWRNISGAGGDFEVEASADGRALSFERRTPSGLHIRRRVELGDSYLLRLREEWRHARENADPIRVEKPELTLGPMTNLPGESLVRGLAFLGVDTLSPGGERVRYWGPRMASWFKEEQRPNLPFTVRRRVPDTGRAVDWVAVKNKYFVQILRPEGGAEGAWAEAKRLRFPEEEINPAFRPRIEIASTGAALMFRGGAILAGAEPVVHEMEFYVGPKKYAELQRLAYHQADVMEFGMWGGIGKILLSTLNGLYRVIPNYGVAIILLTILIRIVFWPITHRGTQSMKRMQEIQPLVNEIRAKFKDNPQRQQREIMALYKEHRINPVSGCLPMLIQIPVFIALFVVLRSAIELRFAPFLWVRDLSEPENLLAGRLPFGLSLNLLPLIMTATQIWQQRLTPQAGDPSQQKLMTFMPIIMLVFFYNFASGLVLYWTTNQCLMIGQQLIQRHRVGRKA